MRPEVPMASKFVQAHPKNYAVGSRTSYKRVVIHCTDGGSRAEPVAEMFAGDPDKVNDGKRSSAHLVVDQDGTIIQCVALKDIAYHAHEMNAISVGVEHCARTPGEKGPHDPGLPPSSALYQASARLVAYLLAAAGLQPTREFVVGHAESDKHTTHDRCPEGCGWSWDGYMALVREEYAKILPASTPVA